MEQFDMLADLFARQKAAQEARGYQFPMEGQNAADYIKSHTLHCVDERMATKSGRSTTLRMPSIIKCSAQKQRKS